MLVVMRETQLCDEICLSTRFLSLKLIDFYLEENMLSYYTRKIIHKGFNHRQILIIESLLENFSSRNCEIMNINRILVRRYVR